MLVNYRCFFLSAVFENHFFKNRLKVHLSVNSFCPDQAQHFIGSAITIPVEVFLTRDSGVAGLRLNCGTVMCP